MQGRFHIPLPEGFGHGLPHFPGIGIRRHIGQQGGTGTGNDPVVGTGLPGPFQGFLRPGDQGQPVGLMESVFQGRPQEW